MRTISQGPAHFSLWPWVKGLRIHTHLSEWSLWSHSSNLGILTCIGVQMLASVFCRLLFLSLASVTLRGYFFISSSYSVPWEAAVKGVLLDSLGSRQPSLPLTLQNQLPFSVVPLQIHDPVIQKTRILGGSEGTEVLICRTWILTTVESPFKRVSLKPRAIFFFSKPKKKKAIYTFGSNFLSSLCYYGRSCVCSLTDWLLLACWEVIYIQGEEAAIGSAALKAVV